MKNSIWILPLAIAVLVALLGWWGNDRLKATLQGELKNQLSATLNANVTALGIWSTNQTRLALALADDPSVQSLANQIFQNQSQDRRQLQPQIQQFIRDLRPRLTSLGYEVGQLVDTNFIVVASSMRGPFGGNMQVSDTHTNKFAQLFASGDPVIITPFRPEMLEQRRQAQRAFVSSGTNATRRFFRAPPQITGRPRRGDVTLMQVAAPVRDDNGTIVGALALIIDPDKEFSRILSVARSGASGETYAFDQTGLLISHSRFDAQLKQIGLLAATNTTSALNLRLHDPGGDMTREYQPPADELGTRPLTVLAASAVDGVDETYVDPTRDYRGVPVVGASCWLPEFGFGVATQIDAAEAYRPLHVLQWLFVLLILCLLLCATGMFAIANISWRRRLDAAELRLKRLGQYTLEEKIGAGGMGVVYRARHALLRRDTAVKLLLPDKADPLAIARFEREVRLTCQLTHPNTIQVYDYGHSPDGIFYYAMEYLHGLNLHDLVSTYGPQLEGRVIYILAQICDSLTEAHAVGLIHRDIKPGNIFLCHRGGIPDCVKVLDFGLVREYGKGSPDIVDIASQRFVEGTPWFTPPEAIRSDAPVDPRSDIYALGALGYFLLTRHYIFDAETVEDIHQKQLTAAPVPPSQRTDNPISAEMEQILLRCLEKDAAMRPQSAGELRALLEHCAAAANWGPEARAAWWAAYHQQPTAGQDGNTTTPSTPLQTVRIDLASRVE